MESIGYGGFHVVRSLTYKLREKDTMKMGDIGTEFKYETDRIRVWDLVLESGISSDWHKHDKFLRDPWITFFQTFFVKFLSISNFRS